MPLTIGFDCDETLMPYAHRFWLGSLRCATLISETMGVRSPSAMRILQCFEEVERVILVERGFGDRRFPEAWIATYRALCTERERTPDPRVERRIVRAVATMHLPPFRLYPGTRRVLDYCVERGHRIHLITQGPRELQQRKLRTTAIDSYFHSFWFGEDGPKPAGIGRMLTDPTGAPCVMVGDGRGSDVKPALELGMEAVWLSDGDPWAAFDAEVDPSLHHTIRTIGELPDVLERIERSCR